MTGAGGVMADVTRWVLSAGSSIVTASGSLASITGTANQPTVVITEADYLAALERVRVETLLEARKSVVDLYALSPEIEADFRSTIGGEAALDRHRSRERKTLAAIDRLINAATTGATDD